MIPLILGNQLVCTANKSLINANKERIMNSENITWNGDGKIHNMANLKDYDLFHNPFNKTLDVAFITSPNKFEITLKNNVKVGKRDVEMYFYDYDKTDAAGKFVLNKFKVPVFTQQGNKLTFETTGLDLSKNYIVEVNGERSDLFLDPKIGGILDTYFDAGNIADLGAKYSGSTVVFKVWSPPAGKIILKLFDKDQKPVKSVNDLVLKRGEKGLWAIELTPSDLVNVKSPDGLYYQYEVYAYGKTVTALDPYAKSMAAFNPAGEDVIGKGAIVSFTNSSAVPLKYDKNFLNSKYIANEVDMVVYEVHVRDFTIQPGVLKDEIAGTFNGLTKKMGYLKNLGITHIQLLPAQNFYTVNENDRAYKGTDAPQGNYNWGYDPHNYFTPEGWFASDAANPYTRIREYREMIQQLHDQGIGVIMDVVYNHTYITEVFENIAPGCYYRYDKDLKISETTGAGPSLECRRKMVKKLIIESLKHFVENYHVDGFRFDLMSFFDHETVEAIRSEVGPVYNKENANDLILQGEAWLFSDIDTDPKTKGINAAVTKLNYPEKKINLGFFNDCSRDSYTGRESNKGFVQGIISDIDKVATGIVGGLKGYDAGKKSFNSDIFKDSYNTFANGPENCLNYLTIHDGYTLWDKLNLSFKDETMLVRARMMRMANAMLFTSQGKIIMQAGDELLRTKPLAQVDKEQTRAHTSEFVTEEEGTKYFHENTYCSNDYTNMIRWNRLTGPYSKIAAGMVEYYKGLVEMRRNIPAFRYKNAEDIKKGLVFLGADVNIESRPSLYNDFNDGRLKKLIIKFINGPRNAVPAGRQEKYYIAGEVHPKGMDANPAKNDYAVSFDENGAGKIEIRGDQIETFDLSKWGSGSGLNIKLVKEPGSWNTIAGAYSGTGNNLIKINAVNENFEALIDLSVPDCVAGEAQRKYEGYIAYWLDNTLEKDIPKGFKGTAYAKLLVIHNAGDSPVTVQADAIQEPAKWAVILDDHNAGIAPLAYIKEITSDKGKTNVLIEKGRVTVPAKSSAVVAK
ncbi:MAG: hypothetical protein HY958_08530 [Bacteroidia bacterium]|nr:hypothetical protein [Bacteroidia bacterium]